MWNLTQRSHTVTFMWDPRLYFRAPSTPARTLLRDSCLRPLSFGPFRSFGVLCVAAAAALVVPCSAQSDSGAASRALSALRTTPMRRVAANPDLSARVQLGGHLPGWVRAENTAAATVPVSAPLQVTVVLKR